jgi:cupin superfamily acireductone dioxygenase involved in methionine salvage
LIELTLFESEMPILRSELGEVYTSVETMNSFLSPSEVGCFKINSRAKKLTKTPITSAKNAKLYKQVPLPVDAYFRQKKLSPSVAITYWYGSSEQVHERIKRSLQPHTNSIGNNEAHLLFAGALIMYIDNGQGQYAVLMQPGDWIYIDGQSEAWPKLTHEKNFTIASYHSAPITPIDEFHKQLKFTNTQMKPIL